jgi:hypothetical protein
VEDVRAVDHQALDAFEDAAIVRHGDSVPASRMGTIRVGVARSRSTAAGRSAAAGRPGRPARTRAASRPARSGAEGRPAQSGAAGRPARFGANFAAPVAS